MFQSREPVKIEKIWRIPVYFHSRGLSNPTAGLRLHERTQHAHDIDLGRQTEDKSRNLIEQTVSREPSRFADLLVLS